MNFYMTNVIRFGLIMQHAHLLAFIIVLGSCLSMSRSECQSIVRELNLRGCIKDHFVIAYKLLGPKVTCEITIELEDCQSKVLGLV